MHRPGFTESHLVFHRMNVDIHPLRRQFEEHHPGRPPTVKQHIPIGLLHRVRNHAITDPATIDIEILRLSPGIGGRRPFDVAPYLQRAYPGVQVEEIGRRPPAHDLPETQCGRFGAYLDDGPASVLETKSNRGIYQGQTANNLGDMDKFGRRSAQKFTPCRNRKK